MYSFALFHFEFLRWYSSFAFHLTKWSFKISKMSLDLSSRRYLEKFSSKGEIKGSIVNLAFFILWIIYICVFPIANAPKWWYMDVAMVATKPRLTVTSSSVNCWQAPHIHRRVHTPCFLTTDAAIRSHCSANQVSRDHLEWQWSSGVRIRYQVW